MGYSLGTIDPLVVTKFDGFDLPDDMVVVRLLSDGTTTHNAVLQSSGSSLPTATLAGITEDAAVIAALRAYRLSHAIVTWTDDQANTSSVVVATFSAAQDKISGLWDWTMTLHEQLTAPEGPGVGVPVAGLATTLAADPAVGATNLKVASVTTVTVGQFVRVGAAGVAATAANSEIVRVLTVGTTGSGGTGLGIESDTGGGMVLDRANADEVKTITGTLLAAPAATGATNIRVDSVTALTTSTILRIGYLGHYELRTPTVVGTALAGGTGIDFAAPLKRDHGLDAWVVVVA